MASFTPERTRSQFGGRLVMNPITMPICIMNQYNGDVNSDRGITKNHPGEQPCFERCQS